MKNIDIAKMVGAVDRRLESVERDGKPARMIVATRVYDTDIDDAWDALTTRERIERWFLPVDGELKLGGRYQFKGNAGGTITTCDKPRHLAVTWEMMGDVSWVDVLLEVVSAAKTKLTLQHTAHVPEEMWNQFGPGAVGVGWDGGLLGLALHFADKKAGVSAEGQAWQLSDEGKRFSTLSSDDWVRAAIAAGGDPDHARAAGVRTVAFYTGSG